ncbi:MAG TPA: alanine racemase, partial [Vicinamibacterales bacterium]|nr:alanine racemase [Vicinamibacterales bacterium]
MATVHLEALQHNLKQISALVLTSSRADVRTEHTSTAPQHNSTEAQQHGGHGAPSIIAVVKANAYGHGAAQVAKTLEAAGAGMFACADLEEGVALREAGVTRPILVFGALSVSDLSHVFAHALTPTVSTPS